MKNKLCYALILACALPALGFAQDDGEEASKPWTGNLTFASDYRFRGISQTNEDPTIQGTFTWGFDSGVYLSTFASTVDFVPGDGANFEADFVVGWNGDVNDWLNVDTSFVYYAYPFAEVDYDYAEVIGKATFGGMASFMVGYSNDVFNTSEDGLYYAVSGTLTVAEEYTVAGTLGYYDLDDAYGGSITDYSVGVSRPIGPMTVGFAYVNTNEGLEDVYGTNNDGRVVFSLGVNF